MSDKRDALVALIGGIRCTRTLIASDYTLIYFTNPLQYHQPICLRVEGVNINHVIAIILAYYTVKELRAMAEDTLPDEEEYTSGCIAALMNAVKAINSDARLWLGSTPHVVYNELSGVTVHSTYPDNGKLFPQTQVTLVEQGTILTTQYINDLIQTIPTKE